VEKMAEPTFVTGTWNQSLCRSPVGHVFLCRRCHEGREKEETSACAKGKTCKLSCASRDAQDTSQLDNAVIVAGIPSPPFSFYPGLVSDSPCGLGMRTAFIRGGRNMPENFN